MKTIRPLALLLLTGCSTPAIAQNRPSQQISLSRVELPTDTLRVHFIDVGAGMAVLIQTPGGENVFIDGGKGRKAELRKYLRKFVPPGSTILMALVTHPDFDHYKGMLTVFDDYDVTWFVHSGYTSDQLGTTWGTLLTNAEAEGSDIFAPLEDWVDACEFEVLDEGTSDGTEDDVTITYLNVDSSPPRKDAVTRRSFSESERRNNASIVFKVEYGPTSFLFTGDINGRDKDHTVVADDDEIDSEEVELLARHGHDAACSLAATVLQAPHHGSNGSCSLPFLQAVAPTWIVFPAGHQHNHPHPGSWRRAKQVVDEAHMLRTDEGDAMPETRSGVEPAGDDSFIFVANANEITHLFWVKND